MTNPVSTIISSSTSAAAAAAVVTVSPSDSSAGGPSVTSSGSQTATSSKTSAVVAARSSFFSRTTAPPALDLSEVAPPDSKTPKSAKPTTVDRRSAEQIRDAKLFGTKYIHGIQKDSLLHAAASFADDDDADDDYDAYFSSWRVDQSP